MADIAIDATAASGEKTATPFTWTITNTAGTGIWVGVSTHNSDPCPTVTGVKFGPTSGFPTGSVNLTHLRTDDPADATRRHTEIWYAASGSLPTGACTVEVTLSGTPADVAGFAITLTNVDTANPMDVAGGAGNLGASTAASCSITTITDKAFVIGVMKVHNNNAITIGAGQTQPTGFDVTFGAANGEAAGGYRTNPVGIGATTISWTLNPSDDWIISTCAFKPVTVATSGLEWKQPTSQPDARYNTSIVTKGLLIEPYLPTTPTLQQNTFDWVQPSCDVIWN